MICQNLLLSWLYKGSVKSCRVNHPLISTKLMLNSLNLIHLYSTACLLRSFIGVNINSKLATEQKLMKCTIAGLLTCTAVTEHFNRLHNWSI